MKRKIQAGVYQIKNLVNNKIYIGSSANIWDRIWDHKCRLRKKCHANPHLQNAWDKYGEHNFEFSIVEVVHDIPILQDREQHWINVYEAYKRDKGYNISEKVDQVNYENHFNAMEWIVTTPNGIEIEIKNLEKYCRENKLNRGAMGAVSKGKSKHHKGYKCREKGVSFETWQRSVIRSDKSGGGWKGKWDIISPNGKLETVLSLTDFCKRNNLSQGNMTEVALGRRNHHKGFKCSKHFTCH